MTSRLSLPHCRIAQRLKTTNTLIEKLARRTRLSSVQDIAGLRIIARMTLIDQDRVASELAATLADVSIVDRRAKPSHGYRAVHVVGKIDDANVELQVRTLPQQAWAEATEALADIWGRQIRYGEAPDGPDDAAIEARARALRHWIAASGHSHRMEEIQADAYRELSQTHPQRRRAVHRRRARAYALNLNRLIREVDATALPELISAFQASVMRTFPDLPSGLDS